MQLKNNNWIKLFLIIFVSLVIFEASPKPEKDESATISLYKIVEIFKLDFDIDPIIGSIKLKKDNRNVILYPSRSEMLYAGKIKTLSCGIATNGSIFVTGSALDTAIAYLLRKRVKWSVINGNLAVGNEVVSTRRRISEKPKQINNYKAHISAVVIDPGHGGKDPGGIGYKGIKEKDIVLKIAKYVSKYLSRKRKGIKVIMTRDKDEFISLEKRAEIANKLDASIFISIHANVSYNKKAIGYESYYLSINPQDKVSREVADKENSVINYEDVKNKKYLLDIINHIVDLEYRRESIKLAKSIQSGIGNSIGTLSIDRGVKGAYFYVLKAVKMPSVLVETGFVTNSIEVSHLCDISYQKKLANGIANGISNFIDNFEETNGFSQQE